MLADAITAGAGPLPVPKQGKPCNLERLTERLVREPRVWLILDYDGTLADFALTPEHVVPDPELIRLLSSLVQHPNLRLATVSGRALSQVQELLPVAGMLLAGSYGIELQTPAGEHIERVAYAAVRPALDALKPKWTGLISGRRGFFLEDKGWTLALHGRLADGRAAEEVLARARALAQDGLPNGALRLLDTYRFLEVGPRLANKGVTVDYLLEHHGQPGVFPVYVGDDSVDEPAFAAVRARSGVGVLVARRPRPSQANCRIRSPQAVRCWLQALLNRLAQHA